jgi:hypothetical protein
MRRVLLAGLLPLLLSSCIDTQNVVAFASAVTVVTAATSTMIAADQDTCANINATLTELADLPRIGSIGSANCADLKKTLQAITGVNKVLANYAKALNDISQNTFVNYDSEVNKLQSILKSLPNAPSQAQISAVTGLAGWIASLVTEEQRDKAIRAAMVGPGGEMTENFHATVGLLSQLVTQYSDGTAADAAITHRSLDFVRHEYGASEPVAVEEMSIRLDAHTRISDDQKAAIAQYKTALAAMDKAFDAATAQPSAKVLLGDVRDFAKQARSVYQSFTAAFAKG